MSFPSTLSSFARPTASDRLNSPSHSALHNTVSSALGQVEAVIGTDASTLGTIIGDLRSASSGGGGHVQTAVKGGTGQTTYAKGDILVASSPSVLTKLAVGTDGQSLQANSSVAAGIQWVANQTNRIGASASIVTVVNSSAETSVMSVTVPGSVLGTGNVVRARLFVHSFQVNGAGTLLKIRGMYGNTSVATINVGSVVAGLTSITGLVEMDIIANAATNAQRAITRTDLTPPTPYAPTQSFIGMKNTLITPIAEDGSANKVIGFTVQWNGAAVDSLFNTAGYTVEKIT